MNTSAWIVAFAIFGVGSLLAADDQLTISESRIPNSPAFTLLGVNPTAVEHPSSPMQLGASLASSFGKDDSGSLGNIAMEFSPFWWTKNSRRLSYEDYYNIRFVADDTGGFFENKSGGQDVFRNLYQTLTFSLATSESDPMGNTNLNHKGQAVGIGFRSTLIKGKLSERALDSRGKLYSLDERASEEMILRDGKKAVLPSGLFAEMQAAEKEYASALEYLAGFQLEIAGGTTFDLLERDFDNAEFRRLGAWMNASYRSDRSGGLMEQFALLANTRYFYTDSATGDRVSSVDLGARITWISPSKHLPLSIAAEYVRRFNNGGNLDDVDRLGILATMKLNDRYAVYFSHGSNIEKGVLSSDENVTYLGVNFLLGKASARRERP